MHKIWQAHPTIQVGLADVLALMHSSVQITHPDVKQKIMDYMDAPGKYLRSGLLLLMAELKNEGEMPENKYYLAAAVEVLHLATLIHDDVIDLADERRGTEAMQHTYSNRIAIYAGDYLLTLAAQLLKDGHVPEQIGERYHQLVAAILNGEISQLMHQHDPTMTFNQYLKQVRRKTALLFALSTYAGYYQAGDSERHYRQALAVGEHLGMAFQLADDLLDYQSERQQSGKPHLQDIQNGIYTAPLHFLKQADPEHFMAFAKREQWGPHSEGELLTAIEEAQGFEQTEALMYRFTHQSLKHLSHLPGEEQVKQEIKQLFQELHLLPTID
ncbi:MAG: polyprenyl synthetase family protein [Aerococcus sp.]|nr:polyprenyl synthetase family protein [Aerococcus sp.]